MLSSEPEFHPASVDESIALYLSFSLDGQCLAWQSVLEVEEGSCVFIYPFTLLVLSHYI